MNLIFGKYQLSIKKPGSSDGISNNKIGFINHFNVVRGFGLSRIHWVVSSIGGSKNARISIFFFNSVINRESLLSKISRYKFKRFVGVELNKAIAKFSARRRLFKSYRRITKVMDKKKPSKKKL